MARVIINGPPVRRYCLACLMRAKQRQYEMFEDDIKAGYAASGDSKPVIIPWPAGLASELAEGEYRGVAWEFPHLGVVDGLCWDDLAGIAPTKTELASQLDTSAQLPPGFRKGRH